MVLYERRARDVSDASCVWHDIHSMDIGMMELYHIPIDDDQLMSLLTYIRGHNDNETLDYRHCQPATIDLCQHHFGHLSDSYSCPVNQTNRIGVQLKDLFEIGREEWRTRIFHE